MSKTLGSAKVLYKLPVPSKRAKVLTAVTFRGHHTLMIMNKKRIPEKMIRTEHNTEILIRDYKK